MNAPAAAAAEEAISMLLIVLRVLYVFICAGAIATIVHPQSNPPKIIEDHPLPAFFILLAMSQLVMVVDFFIRRKRLDLISAVYFGLLIGVLLAYLSSLALRPIIQPQFEPITVGLMLIAFPYMCISLLLQTKDDFRFIIPYVEFVKEMKGGRPLIVDTSALIDGRIADVMDTHVFETEILVPSMVLEELQGIADSNDKLRRTRGRRGLDVLTKLQQNPQVDVRMYEVKDKDETLTVDQQIVALAKRLGGRIVTSDFNLNKVASVQGVTVVNLNDVANSLKPRYLHGEQIRIRVIREGESFGQGVGYLDDGTMVVCEQASQLVGQDIDVVITSMLQNSAGRMIFGRLAGSLTPSRVGN